jgi:hypothetical protein
MTDGIKTAIQLLTTQLERQRRRLRHLENGTSDSGTVEPRSSLPNSREATQERIDELKEYISTNELALKEFELLR